MKSIVDSINNNLIMNGYINKTYTCYKCNNTFKYAILKRFNIEINKVITCPYCKTSYSVGRQFNRNMSSYLNHRHIKYNYENQLEKILKNK